jgi:hypothetical protein
MPITDEPQTIITPQQKANRLMRTSARQVLKRAVSQYESALSDFWTDEELTPQQKSDALGTDAADFFAFYNELRKFIIAVSPSENLTPVSNYGTFTVNGDGTVTIDSVV